MGFHGQSMKSLDQIKTAVESGRNIRAIVSEGAAIMSGRIAERDKPPHIPDQRDRIRDWFDTDQERWLIFMDAGRYDIFDQLVWEHFDGSLNRTWNGGVGYTGDWAVRNLTQDFGKRGLWSWLPLRELAHVDYDGRNWFAHAPDIHTQSTVDDRLATLGYKEGGVDGAVKESPWEINNTVRARMDELNGGVVRYVKPHPPLDGLQDLTSESTKTEKTLNALESGELTHQELTEAYIETYRTAFDAATDLVPDLDGDVVITADHGTCLACGQVFHGRQYEKHDHLTIMPWFEVSETL